MLTGRYGTLALALAVLLLAAARVADPVLPALAVLRGPLGVALVLLGALVALARARPGWRPPGPATWRALDAAAAILLVAAGYAYVSRLRVTGDEPHYLVMAQSLWREGDLDLRDNYDREDWRADTPGPVAPHYGAPRRDGRPFPAHSPGLPALLAPVYALGGRRLCAAALALMAAAMAVQVRSLAARVLGETEAAFAWALALGPPTFFYSFHVYTEVPSALAVASGLRLLLAGHRTVASAAGAALAASALPWLHVKMVPAAAVLGVVALVVLRGRARAAFVAIAALMAGAFLLHYQRVFGVPTPLALYGGAPVAEQGSLGLGLLGILLDRSYGLLVHAPAFVLAGAGIAAALRERVWGWPVLAILAAVALPAAAWRMWWGGQCPPARFLVPAVPALALLAAALLRRRVGLARWAGGLLGAGWGLALYMWHDPGALMLVNRGDRPTRLWEALAAERSVADYLPSLVAATPRDLAIAGVWVAALVALLALHALARRNPRVDGWFGGLALPMILLAAATRAIGWL